MKLNKKEISDYVQNFLKEDRSNEDITSKYFIDSKQKARAFFLTEENIVLSGNNIILYIFKKYCKNFKLISKLEDGKKIKKKTKILVLEGDARDILSIERTALNLLQHLSGISTLTSKFSKKINSSKTILLDTRKTTPGLRTLEKYAAYIGGAKNHRLNLAERFMIKDNHLFLNSKIFEKIKKMKTNKRNTVIMECDNLYQVKKAILLKIKHILLDNMNIKKIKEACKLIGKSAKVEVSGEINLQNIKKISNIGVNFISVGSITQSAPAVKISLELKKI
jgi:nicotinate-nucleotide pyrophosphorylase (carboxylating)